MFSSVGSLDFTLLAVALISEKQWKFNSVKVGTLFACNFTTLLMVQLYHTNDILDVGHTYWQRSVYGFHFLQCSFNFQVRWERKEYKYVTCTTCYLLSMQMWVHSSYSWKSFLMVGEIQVQFPLYKVHFSVALVYLGMLSLLNCRTILWNVTPWLRDSSAKTLNMISHCLLNIMAALEKPVVSPFSLTEDPWHTLSHLPLLTLSKLSPGLQKWQA